MSDRRTWFLTVPLAVVLVVVGVSGIALVRYGPLDRPWGYVFLAPAALGAVACVLLAVARAHEVADD
ncbi:MAG: hypothetical protein PGN07_01990 [Aeromicrobium erythreum]